MISFVRDNVLKAEHLRFGSSIHTVDQCVEITGFSIEEITKCVVMDYEGKCVVGLVPAKYRVSTRRVAKILGFPKVKVSTAEIALNFTGYPVGGMPFVGYSAIRLVDPKTFDLEYIYTGGGSDRSLLKLWVSEIYKLEPIIAKIRK